VPLPKVSDVLCEAIVKEGVHSLNTGIPGGVVHKNGGPLDSSPVTEQVETGANEAVFIIRMDSSGPTEFGEDQPEAVGNFLGIFGSQCKCPGVSGEHVNCDQEILIPLGVRR
jgi:hypothetical protein